jgi:hypothetical protein
MSGGEETRAKKKGEAEEPQKRIQSRLETLAKMFATSKTEPAEDIDEEEKS